MPGRVREGVIVINPRGVRDMLLRDWLWAIFLGALLFLAILMYTAVSVVNACLEPVVPVPYTQLRDIPYEEGEPQYGLGATNYTSRYLSRAQTTSAVLLRAVNGFLGSGRQRKGVVTDVAGQIVYRKSRWSSLFYDKKGRAVLVYVHPVQGGHGGCGVKWFEATIGNMFSPMYMSDRYTWIPTSIEGTEDWREAGNDSIPGPCVAITTTPGKEMVSVAFETTRNHSRKTFVRSYSFTGTGHLGAAEDTGEESNLATACGDLPMDVCWEVTLPGSLPLRALDWIHDGTCLLYSRGNDATLFRTMCFARTGQGVRYTLGGVGREAGKGTWLVSAYHVPTHKTAQTPYCTEKGCSVLVSLHYSDKGGWLEVDTDWVGGGEPVKKQPPSVYWDTPDESLWGGKCAGVQVAVSSNEVRNKYLTAVSTDGNTMVITLMHDTVIVLDLNKIAFVNNKTCDNYTTAERKSTADSVTVLSDIPLMGSMLWALTPPGLRETVAEVYYDAGAVRELKTVVSGNGKYLAVITAKGVRVFQKRGLTAAWQLTWMLEGDDIGVGLGRAVVVVDVVLVTEGEREYLVVVYEGGAVVAYLLVYQNNMFRAIAAVTNALIATGVTCAIIYLMPSDSPLTSFALVTTPLFLLILFDIFIIDIPSPNPPVHTTTASIFELHRSCPIPPPISDPIPAISSREVIFRGYHGVWGPLPSQLVYYAIPIFMLGIPYALLLG